MAGESLVVGQPEPKKSLGQHWLHDKAALVSIADVAQVGEDDVVLEVGPGLGTLTAVLLERGATVRAVEYDTILAANLASRLGKPAKLSVEEHDILTYRFDLLPADYKIVANIPYYLTSHLLRQLTETPNMPIAASLLVQKEVAERVCAGPGHMSLLSVAVQMQYDCSLGLVVPARLFTPPPKVDSQVLVLYRRAQPLIAQEFQADFFQVVKAGFSERRKKLRSSLSGGLRIEKGQADALLQSAGISTEARAQELTLAQWVSLAQSWVLLRK